MSACCVLVDDAKICLKRLWLSMLSMQPACNPALRETPSDACPQVVPIEDRSRAELDNHEALSNPEGTALF